MILVSGQLTFPLTLTLSPKGGEGNKEQNILCTW